MHVHYVSPLKALSNDVRRYLQEPPAGIRDRLLELGIDDVPIRDAVRTDDTSPFGRNRMRRTPPYILVTTPESLFILLASESSRAMLKSVKGVIVDELHSVEGSKRGSHLMLSLERLDARCGRSPVRVGRSATVKPLETIARCLVGTRGRGRAEPASCRLQGRREGETSLNWRLGYDPVRHGVKPQRESGRSKALRKLPPEFAD